VAATDGTTAAGGNGGNGLSSNITGSAVTRAGGGGGGPQNTNVTTPSSGGTGGGGAGASGVGPAVEGTVNTGSGGGGAVGAIDTKGVGRAGGSGVVILRYPDSRTITLGAGLTGSTTTSGANKITTITAGTGNVSWV
jgi:hypothetical protein